MRRDPPRIRTAFSGLLRALCCMRWTSTRGSIWRATSAVRYRAQLQVMPGRSFSSAGVTIRDAARRASDGAPRGRRACPANDRAAGARGRRRRGYACLDRRSAQLGTWKKKTKKKGGTIGSGKIAKWLRFQSAPRPPGARRLAPAGQGGVGSECAAANLYLRVETNL